MYQTRQDVQNKDEIDKLKTNIKSLMAFFNQMKKDFYSNNLFIAIMPNI